MVSILARAFDTGECCAWIDGGGSFDPESAAEAGLQLNRLLWVNCKGNSEHALKATDRFVMHPFLPPPIVGTEPMARELRLCLRRFRPPYTAQVRLENRRPAHVSAPAMRGAIVKSRGPWRMSGNWWSEDVWNRDRWDVALDSGALYRLFQEIDSGRWFC